MIDLNKSLEFFNPQLLNGYPVHIVGCGAIGSHVAEILARLGVENIHLYDDDRVASHNIANQMFSYKDIGKAKVQAVAEMIDAINPNCAVTQHDERVQPGTRLKGYVVLCVDSIVPRQFILEANTFNPNCKAIFDFIMGLTSGQFYCANGITRMQNLAKTMQFTDEEADVNTPKSACNFELSVVYTIKVLVGVGVNEMVKFWKGEDTHLTTYLDLSKECNIIQM
jgi:molybdopterin/thiamine biosynthesis adenylyltransferase